MIALMGLAFLGAGYLILMVAHGAVGNRVGLQVLGGVLTGIGLMLFGAGLC